MRALVVGACGFIGQGLMRMLATGGSEVLGVDGRGARGEGMYAWREGLYESLEPILRDTDLIVYAAGTLLPRMDTPINTAWERDCRPFNELLQSLVKAKSRARFLLLSSGGAVYGLEQGELTESSPTRPASPYGLVRLFMEQSLLFQARASLVEPVIFRLSNVYGPGQRLDGGSALILTALRAAAGHGPLTLWGDGKQTKDFLYIDDLVEAVRRILPSSPRSAFPESTFNIARGQSHSVLQVIDTIARVTGREVPLVQVEGPKTDVPHVALSPARARQVLGFQAGVDLEEGIRRYWTAIRAHEK